MSIKVSIIIPAKNESNGLKKVLPEIRSLFPEAEILVVDDGSVDETASVALQHGAQIHHHPQSLGNGAAVKAGARKAQGEFLVFMDADGQHQPQDIAKLLTKLDEGYDMVVGARGKGSQAGLHRSLANRFYNKLASWMVGQMVADLTSGFRAVRAEKFRKFLYLLPNGFSYPTTITMSFFRAGYPLAYVPIHAPKRIGKSHLKIARDGARFLLIIFRVGTLYSPLKIFFPITLLFFFAGFANYLHSYITLHRFTNMSAVLFITAIIVFLIGLISEQITSLNYRDSE